MKKNSESFIEIAKTKSKEIGQTITQKALEHVDQVTATLQASIGNELVIANIHPNDPILDC